MLGTGRLIVEGSAMAELARRYDTLRGYKDTSRSSLLSTTGTVKRKKMEAALQKMKKGFVELIEITKRDSTIR